MSGSKERKALEYHNIAHAEARVDAQIGIVHGDVHLHKNRETAEEKAERGEKLLSMGYSRDAEEALRDAINDGHSGARVAYYWALSILAGRSWKQLEASHLRNLEAAYGMAPKGATDTWTKALRVVKGIIELLPAVDGHSTIGSASENEVLAAYDAVDSERSAEIWRYLDQVLAGVMLERISQAAADQAASERLANGRAIRVWKFFEPDPEPPLLIPPSPKVRRTGAWLKLLSAAILGTLASIPIIPELIRGGGSSFVGFVLLMVGLLGTIRNGLQRQFILDERQVELRMFRRPFDEDGIPWKAEGQEKFAKMVVAGAFNRFAPSDPEEEKNWNRMTREYQLNLTREFVEAYENPEVLRRPSILRWLARWHAEQLAYRWDPDNTHELYGCRRAVPARLYLAMTAAAIAIVLGASLLWWSLWIHGSPVEYTLFPILTVSGIRISIDKGCWLVSSARAYIKEVEAADRRYQDEVAAYRAWCEILADQPSEPEMASWLDQDKRYLRNQAMELYQVTRADLIAHVTYCSPTKQARAAYSTWGSKYYTEYLVGVLLMTDGGVRLAEFHLDMLNGVERDPERLSFRYDAVASVHVSTSYSGLGQRAGPRSGSRSDGQDRRYETGDRRPMDRSGYRTIFRIVLLNQEEPIEAFLDLFDDEIADSQADAHELLARALDASGVAGALSMMEAITADGKEWLEAQKTRDSRARFHSHHQSGEGSEMSANGGSRSDDPVLN